MFYLIHESNPSHIIAHGSAREVLEVAKPIWDAHEDESIYSFFRDAVKHNCSAISFNGYEFGYDK